jgi:ribosomal protein S18 acetylase RimI-like enzyme
MAEFEIREISDSDRGWVAEFLSEHWGSPTIVSRGRIHPGDKLPGFIAVAEEQNIGLITYNIADDECEIVSLNSIRENMGVGTKLIDAVRDAAIGCNRLWLVTTNDNLPSIAFYIKRGFSFKTIHEDAIAESRKMKPSIPVTGYNNIPIKDEIEFEIIL